MSLLIISFISGSSLLVGSPQQVIDKILWEYELFGNTRFLFRISVGTLPHAKVMRAIELLSKVVAPAIKKGSSKIRSRSGHSSRV